MELEAGFTEAGVEVLWMLHGDIGVGAILEASAVAGALVHRGAQRYESSVSRVFRTKKTRLSWKNSPKMYTKVICRRFLERTDLFESWTCPSTDNVSTKHMGQVCANHSVNTNRGTAYISYNAAVDAEAAISHMHEAQLDGAVIKVSIVLPRRRFSHSPPPAKRGSNFERFEARGPPPGSFRGPPGPPAGRGGRYRSPPRRERPPYDRPMGRGRDNTYRPRSYSRSRSRSPFSPRRSRSRSFSSRSRSPPRRRYDSPVRGGRRRRSPSYSSYSSDSRSRSRGRGPRGRR